MQSDGKIYTGPLRDAKDIPLKQEEVEVLTKVPEQHRLNEFLNYKFEQYVKIKAITAIGKEYVAMRDCFKAGYLFREKLINHKETEENGIQV